MTEAIIESISSVISIINFATGKTLSQSSNPNVIVVNIEYVLQRHLQKASECILFQCFLVIFLTFALFLKIKTLTK